MYFKDLTLCFIEDLLLLLAQDISKALFSGFSVELIYLKHNNLYLTVKCLILCLVLRCDSDLKLVIDWL